MAEPATVVEPRSVAPGASARLITTKRAAAAALIGRPGPRILVAAATAAAAVRLTLGPPALVDLLAAVAVVAAVGPVEWVVHRHLLHAPPTSRRERHLATARDHEAHHDQPDDIDLLVFSARGAVIFSIAIVAVAGGAGAVTAAATSVDPATIAASVWWWGTLAFLHYEWVHLVSHTRHRWRSGVYRRSTARHLRHHHREPQRGFGVTSSLGDVLFGTRLGRS